jgi:hypothetical protein
MLLKEANFCGLTLVFVLEIVFGAVFGFVYGFGEDLGNIEFLAHDFWGFQKLGQIFNIFVSF